MSIEQVMPSNHLKLCCPLLLAPSVFPSIRVSSSESVLCIKWPRYWSFSFSISPSSEYSGLISFRMDWFDLLVVQATQESSATPQFKNINSSMLTFFIIQLSYPYTTTGKNIALTRKYAVQFRRSFSSKEQESFNFISPSAVILEPKKNNLSLFELFSIYLP